MRVTRAGSVDHASGRLPSIRLEARLLQASRGRFCLLVCVYSLFLSMAHAHTDRAQSCVHEWVLVAEIERRLGRPDPGTQRGQAAVPVPSPQWPPSSAGGHSQGLERLEALLAPPGSGQLPAQLVARQHAAGRQARRGRGALGTVAEQGAWMLGEHAVLWRAPAGSSGLRSFSAPRSAKCRERGCPPQRRAEQAQVHSPGPPAHSLVRLFQRPSALHSAGSPPPRRLEDRSTVFSRGKAPARPHSAGSSPGGSGGAQGQGQGPGAGASRE